MGAEFRQFPGSRTVEGIAVGGSSIRGGLGVAEEEVENMKEALLTQKFVHCLLWFT